MSARHPAFLPLLFLGTLSAFAQDEPLATPAPMREISPGVMELGKMRLDQNKRTLSFPAKVNMDNGALEYLLVTPHGSTHESLLVAEVQPNDVHFAMLLLGAQGAGILAPAPDAKPPAQIDATYLQTAPKLKGDRVTLLVKWRQDGAEKTVPVESWIANLKTAKPMAKGPWIYTGSMFSEERFQAQTEGVFAAVITNPSALINNPREGSDNDQIWTVNEKTVPRAETPVEFIIQLEALAKPTPDTPPK